MLLRLLLALLVALAATPAVAAAPCAVSGAAPMAMAAGGHGDHAPDRPQPHHQTLDACIGCIVPGTARPPSLAAPAPRVAAMPAGFALTGAPFAAGPPATPPPRSAA